MKIMLNPNFGSRLLDLLEQIDQLSEKENRDLLLRGLPPGPVHTIKRSTSMLADLNKIIAAAESWRQLKQSGEWALVIVAKNALRFGRGTQLGNEIETLLAESETAPPEELKVVEEIVIGRDERLPVNFLRAGQIAAQSVAKVFVPRIIDGQEKQEFGYGTGWLLAPNLLITNHHVIEVRERPFEAQATAADLKAQALKATVWFDFNSSESPYVEYACLELLHTNATLDYGILKIAAESASKPAKQLTQWGYLHIVEKAPELRKGDRLNIIQHPLGGPKRIAIRSNYYVDTISTDNAPRRMRYLTDTEPGSSGSPVFDDNWQVIALHHAAVQVPESTYKGAVIKYNNQGIDMRAILKSLPGPLRQEIEEAQGGITTN